MLPGNQERGEDVPRATGIVVRRANRPGSPLMGVVFVLGRRSPEAGRPGYGQSDDPHGRRHNGRRRTSGSKKMNAAAPFTPFTENEAGEEVEAAISPLEQGPNGIDALHLAMWPRDPDQRRAWAR